MSNLLRAENLSKEYTFPDAPPLQVLKDVSLELESGDAVAVLGPSGCGKSTLLNLIGALDQPSSGRVILADRDLSELSAKEQTKVRNEEIGFIFQLHHLLPQCTVFENVLLPALGSGGKDDAEDHAKELLSRLGLGERLDHFPAQLSGGERQRTAVARALINRPRLLLADEPTGSLDEATADSLGSLLLELNQEEGIALIMVTHSEPLAARLDTVYRLHQGKLESS